MVPEHQWQLLPMATRTRPGNWLLFFVVASKHRNHALPTILLDSRPSMKRKSVFTHTSDQAYMTNLGICRQRLKHKLLPLEPIPAPSS